VTYVTTLDVDNSDLSLRPGMTAAATIVATERNGVLLVPNTALRFTPATTDASAARSGSGSGSNVLSTLMPRMPRSTTQRKATETNGNAPGMRQIWVLKDGQPVAQAVQTGISDGRNTEVRGEGLSEGMAVITDQRTAGTAGTAP
jgi:HlyD family secretion protein